MTKRSLEDLQDGEDLCQYCPIPEEGRGVHCYGGQPVMCEGSHCADAYNNYLDSEDDEEEIECQIKLPDVK